MNIILHNWYIHYVQPTVVRSTNHRLHWKYQIRCWWSYFHWRYWPAQQYLHLRQVPVMVPLSDNKLSVPSFHTSLNPNCSCSLRFILCRPPLTIQTLLENVLQHLMHAVTCATRYTMPASKERMWSGPWLMQQRCNCFLVSKSNFHHHLNRHL